MKNGGSTLLRIYFYKANPFIFYIDEFYSWYITD